MLLSFWSPKGGSGTSVVAATCALLLAGERGARLADLDGDQAAILATGDDPETGLGDWLLRGAEAPASALDRLARAAGRNLELLPRGAAPSAAGREAGVALAAALHGQVPVVVDAGSRPASAVRALVEASDIRVAVVRNCYVALRAAVRDPLVRSGTGAVLVDEPGRSLGIREVRDVLGVEVLASFPVRASVARAVDAGVLPTRLPDVVARPARSLLVNLGLLESMGRVA